MTKKQKTIVMKIFAIVFILGMVLSGFIQALTLFQ